MFTVIVVVLSACGTSSVLPSNPDIIGYITSKSQVGNSITVVSKEPKDLSNDGGRKEFYDAITLSNSPGDVEVGELVKVWNDGSVAESYPAQGKIVKLEVIESPLPEGASMTEAEVLKKAIGNNGNLAVRSIDFDAKLKVWTVRFIDIHNDKVWNVEVKEK